MKSMILPLVATCVWIVPSTTALAQPMAPSPEWSGAGAEPAALAYQAGVDAESCDGGACAGDCGCTTCQAECPIFRKFIADTHRALKVLIAGSDCARSSCCAAACQNAGGGCDCSGNGPCDGVTDGGPAAEGGFEIVPRESWPAEYKEVPPPAERTTRSVMRLQRDAYARQGNSRPTLAAEPGRPGVVEPPARPLPARQATSAPSAADRPAGGFTACVTDLAD